MKKYIKKTSLVSVLVYDGTDKSAKKVIKVATKLGWRHKFTCKSGHTGEMYIEFDMYTYDALGKPVYNSLGIDADREYVVENYKGFAGNIKPVGKNFYDHVVPADSIDPETVRLLA